jgi:hypothetical protein
VAEHEELLRRTYDAFDARDIDAVLAVLQPDVDWPNGMEGARELGHDAVRAYWTRQFGMIDSHVELVGFVEDEEGRIVIDVHQVVHDLDGKLISDGNVQHVYTFRDGLVERMDIRED